MSKVRAERFCFETGAKTCARRERCERWSYAIAILFGVFIIVFPCSFFDGPFGITFARGGEEENLKSVRCTLVVRCGQYCGRNTPVAFALAQSVGLSLPKSVSNNDVE